MGLNGICVSAVTVALIAFTVGCRTIGGSKLKNSTGSDEGFQKPKRTIWMSQNDQMVHFGLCSVDANTQQAICHTEQEVLTPLHADEYQLRLRQVIVNYRAPGTPLMLTEDVKLLLQPTVQLSEGEEKIVSSILSTLQDQAMGGIDEANSLFSLAAAPFFGSGGLSSGTWFTKSLITSAKARRETMVPVTQTHLTRLSGIGTDKPAVLADGTVITAHGYSVLWLKDGEKLHEFRSTEDASSSPAVLADGTVVIGKGHRVYWLKNGVRQYVYETNGVIRSSPAILSDGTVVVGSSDHKVYWLNNGEKKFEFETRGQVHSSPTVLFDDTVVIGSHDHKVYWLKDGMNKFEFETGDIVDGSAAATLDGTVIIGSHDDHVYWLKDGMKRFEFKAGGDIRTSPVLLSDESVVVASDDFVIHWLKNGEKNFEFEGHVRAAPAVLSDDTIVVGVGISLYWIKNGVKRFEFQDQGEVYASPAVLPDGRIVVSADNGRIFDNTRIYWLQ